MVTFAGPWVNGHGGDHAPIRPERSATVPNAFMLQAHLQALATLGRVPGGGLKRAYEFSYRSAP